MSNADPAAFDVKSAGFLSSVIALPLAILRRVIAIPAALVDMMEKHGVDR